MKRFTYFALLILLSQSFMSMAFAGTAAVVASQSLSSETDGKSYGGNIWFRGGSNIYKLTSGTTLTTEYTMPSTISGVSVGNSSQFARIDIDNATGKMYFATSVSGVQRIWALDLNNLGAGAVLVFMGLTSTQCDSVGGLAAVDTDLYFSCSSPSYTTKNALYKFTLPSGGAAAKTTSDLTTICTTTTLLGFNDIEYRSQDRKIFALMNHGWYGNSGYIVKIDPFVTLPAPITTFLGARNPGYDGIDIDSSGNIYFVVYANSSGVLAGFQITQETPTVASSSFYTLPTSSTDYIQPGTIITDLGSQSSGSGVIAYFVSGWGSLVKVTGSPPTSYATVNDVVIQLSTVSLILPTSPYIYRQSYSFTAVANAAGKLGFYVNRKAIAGCKALPVNSGNSYTATCTYKPSLHGAMSAYVSFTPSGNYLASTSVTKYFSVVSRATTR